MSKSLPKIKSDEEAEELLSEDLTEYLTPENFKGNFSPVSFEFAPKDATISLRLSKDLLEAVKKASDKRAISYQKFIRESIERAIREIL
ncbi:MAG: CopG family transcriptional regulator [Chloroflexaceae bacterium]|nr:CopG family transcriptional regulator [Chloroflexaceae bacterium]